MEKTKTPVFTQRELDVMTCLLCIDGTHTPSKDIAQRLLMKRRRVDAVIHDILTKIKGNSRQDIMAFIDNTNLKKDLMVRYKHMSNAPQNNSLVRRMMQSFRSVYGPLGAWKLYKKDKNVFFILIGIITTLVVILFFIDNNMSSNRTHDLVKVQLQRPQLIERISKALDQGNAIVALVGSGGVGKTTLARLYSKQSKAKLVWELNGESLESLVLSFKNLAEHLAQTTSQKEALQKIQAQDNQDHIKNLIGFVYSLLSEQSWLLIFDNVDNFAVCRSFLPQAFDNLGRILITTRDQNIQNTSLVSSIITIGELTQEEAVELFTNLLPHHSTDKKAVQELLSHIPPFPLDVSLAAHYIRDAHLTFDQYIKRLEAHQPTFHQHEKKLWSEVSDYPQTRYAIISLSIERILEQNPQYLGLLWMLGHLNSQAIPTELFRHTDSPEIVDAFIHDLRKFSFMSEELTCASHHLFSLHRSTQNILLHYLKSSYEPPKGTHTALPLVKCAQHALEEGDIVVIQKLIPHFETLSYAPHNIAFPMTLGMLYYHTGQYMKAQHLLEEELTIEQNRRKPCHETILKLLVYLGNIYKELLESEKAEQTLQQALLMCQQSFAHDPAKPVRLLISLANIYRRLGEFPKAEILCTQSLALCEKYAPNDYASLAAVHMALCVAHREQGHYKKAEENIHTSLRIYENHLPEQQLDYAHAIRLLGHVCSDQGLYQQARALYEKSLNIFLKHDQSDHPKALWLYAKLGTICRRLGEIEQAHAYLDKAENSSTFSSSYVVMGLTHHERAHLYIQQEKYDQALEEAHKSLEVYTRFYGDQHVKSRRALNLVGYAHMFKGEFEQGEACMLQALQTFGEKGLPLRCQALDYLSELYRRRICLGSKEEAEGFRKKALDYISQSIDVAKEYFPADSVHLEHLNRERTTIENTKPGDDIKGKKTGKRCQ